jgi:hypothetical protein
MSIGIRETFDKLVLFKITDEAWNSGLGAFCRYSNMDDVQHVIGRAVDRAVDRPIAVAATNAVSLTIADSIKSRRLKNG